MIHPVIICAGEKVPFSNSDIAENPVGRGKTGPKAQLAGGFFLDGYFQDGFVRRASRQALYIDGFEKTKVLDALARPP